MTDEAFIDLEEDEPQEIVHWFDQPPVTLSPSQAAGVVVAAFGLGALTAVGILALTGRLRH